MKAVFQLSQRAENEGENPGGLVSCLGAGPRGVITAWKTHPPPKIGRGEWNHSSRNGKH